MEEMANTGRPAKRGRRPLAAIGAACAVLALAFAAYAGLSRLGLSVTAGEAAEIAVAHAGGGRASAPELDWEVWRWLWWVEVWRDNFVYEIYVHPRTGEVVRAEVERE